MLKCYERRHLYLRIAVQARVASSSRTRREGGLCTFYDGPSSLDGEVDRYQASVKRRKLRGRLIADGGLERKWHRRPGGGSLHPSTLLNATKSKVKSQKTTTATATASVRGCGCVRGGRLARARRLGVLLLLVSDGSHTVASSRCRRRAASAGKAEKL